jgi:molecular chaperone DnaJ
VEIVLPRDFAPGKTVRLTGMGKKIGRWQGDLYLTFQTK